MGARQLYSVAPGHSKVLRPLPAASPGLCQRLEAPLQASWAQIEGLCEVPGFPFDKVPASTAQMLAAGGGG